MGNGVICTTVDTTFWQQTDFTRIVLPLTTASNIPLTFSGRGVSEHEATLLSFRQMVEAELFRQKQERWLRALPKGPVAVAKPHPPAQPRPATPSTPNWPAMLRTFAGR